MARFEILMPKMGESIIEATITKWLKQVGDQVNEDDAIAEIATDKVDSEIPSPVEGVLAEVLYKEGDVIAVGKVIAVIDMGGEAEKQGGMEAGKQGGVEAGKQGGVEAGKQGGMEAGKQGGMEAGTQGGVEAGKQGGMEAGKQGGVEAGKQGGGEAGRFYSPLVKSIAGKENISLKELDSITGTGKEGRVTKEDLLKYLGSRTAAPAKVAPAPASKPAVAMEAPKVVMDSGDEVFEMDRMRKLIADHMVMSKQVSPHVTSFIDVDVSAIVAWREKMKDILLKRENEKLTYTHIFMEAAAKALKEFPRVNASVDGYNIIHRKKVNIGMATALPNGNLIVPVIKNADQKSLLGIIKDVNDLADRARKNSLLPDEIQGGTFTITNFGTFDSLTGTPIINQPQVAILGVGAIRKKPVVIETPQGDVIGIRHIMILSLAYDHRVVDGALGGMFLKRMKEMLEGWDVSRTI
jgi:2-oxoglutarate dehydrogenase E2 component (dihydrolipoamide succinyltransferase)